MKARFRDLTAKYKNFRHPVESLFLSRTLRTFFNKFTKKGKKALAQRHLVHAFCQVRLIIHHPMIENLFWQSLRDLEAPLTMLYRRKGSGRTAIPVPRTRIKKKVAGLQRIYRARQQRGDRKFSNRMYHERISLAGPKHYNSVRSAHSAQRVLLYNARSEYRRRWR